MAPHFKAHDTLCPSIFKKKCPLKNCLFRHQLPKQANVALISPAMARVTRQLNVIPDFYPGTLGPAGTLLSPPRFTTGAPRIVGGPVPVIDPVVYRIALQMQAMQAGFPHYPFLGRGSVPSPPHMIPLPQTEPQSNFARPKKAIPCLFFAKGGCAYGGGCAFMHDPSVRDVQVQQAFGGQEINGTVYYPLLAPKPPSPPPMAPTSVFPQIYPASFGGFYPGVVPHTYNAEFLANGVIPNYAPPDYSIEPPAMPGAGGYHGGSSPVVLPATPIPSDILAPSNVAGPGSNLTAMSHTVDDMRSFPHRPSASITSLPMKKGHARRISVSVKSEVENVRAGHAGGRPGGKSRHARNKSWAPKGSFKFP